MLSAMSHQQVPAIPKTNMPRPQLPYLHVNPFLSMIDAGKPPAVKYQVITREGQEIIVGRVKIQTPGNGHAFVLRRFDTGAISLTTMFRAAFPSAGDEAEKVEASWVKANFDSTGANGGPGRDTLRLAGTWVHPEVAQTIAPAYSLEHIVEPLVNAEPDPAQPYRRSTKQASPQRPTAASVAASPAKATLGNARITETVSASPAQIRTPVTPSPTGPTPAKRRKESVATATSPPTSRAADVLPTPRRSGRISASPAPATPIMQTPSRATRPKVVGRSPRTQVKTEKPSSRLTPIDSDNAGADEEEAPEIPGPDIEEDIAEQKELIAKLKAEKVEEEQTKTAAVPEEPSVPSDVSAIAAQESVSSSSSKSSKRNREEEEKLQFNFQEPDAPAVGTREVKTNKRIRRLEPQQKSAAWGVLWFAASFAAAATIPTLFM